MYAGESGTAVTPQHESALSPGRDVPGAAFFIGQTFRLRRRCEESRHLAILGGRVSNRVLADVVGRRGHFPEE